MKKLLLILFTSLVLFASQAETERKIYDTILHTLLPQKKSIRLWTDSKSLADELQGLDDVELVENIDKADIAVVSKKLPKDCSCLLFVTSYHLLKKYKERAVGGFFWQKGRPNILFLKKNLQKEGIRLASSMQQFVEDSL